MLGYEGQLAKITHLKRIPSTQSTRTRTTMRWLNKIFVSKKNPNKKGNQVSRKESIATRGKLVQNLIEKMLLSTKKKKEESSK